MTQTAAKVCIVDSQPLMRLGVSRMLELGKEFTSCGECVDLKSIGAQMEAADVNLLWVGVNRTDDLDFKLLKECVKSAPSIKVVLYADTPDEGWIVRAIQAGVHGFLLKSMSVEELLTALRSIIRGENVMAPQVTRVLIEKIRRDEAVSTVATEKLTRQEIKVLKEIAEGKTNRQIAVELGIGEKTIKNYISTMLAKLGLKRRTEAAVYYACNFK